MQRGVIARSQALACGMPADVIDGLLRTGRWLPLRRGVYSVHTGEPSREATLWAAVLLAGDGAALSHQTAAELFKIADVPSSLIHVAIPHGRQMSCAVGIVIHRSSRLPSAVHPALSPPRTRLEETVLDLAGQATTFEAAFDPVCTAIQRRLTTADRLGEAMSRRQRMRWRADLAQMLGPIGDGVHSLLEYRYVRFVEHRHGLPTATRQARVTAGGRRRYLDNLYRDYGLCVEVDGAQAHPEDQRWNDLHRVNTLAEQGFAVLRYGSTDIDRRSCQTAGQIGSLLSQRGWDGTLRPCSPTCPVGQSTATSSA